MPEVHCGLSGWGLGAMQRGGNRESQWPPHHPPGPARAACLCQAGPIPEETERHPLTSEMRPVRTCLPAPPIRGHSLNRRSHSGYCCPFCSRWLQKKKSRQTSSRCSEVSSTASERAGGLVAQLKPVRSDKSHCVLNPELDANKRQRLSGYRTHMFWKKMKKKKSIMHSASTSRHFRSNHLLRRKGWQPIR